MFVRTKLSPLDAARGDATALAPAASRKADSRMINLTRAARITTLSLLTTATLGGCVGYHSYPPTPEQRARESMGERAPVDVMVRALERVLAMHPPEGGAGGGASGGAFAVNMPVTTPPDIYATVASRVGGEPVTYTNSNLPIYHIAGVRVRNSKAQVDIVWPVGDGNTRSATVWLEGGLQPWAVKRVQEWNEGVTPTPELYYIMREGDLLPLTDPPAEPAEPITTPASDGSDPDTSDTPGGR